MREDIVDFVRCVQATAGSEVIVDNGNSLAGEVRAAGVGASSTVELRSLVQQRLSPQSDMIARAVLDHCATKTGAPTIASASTPGPAPPAPASTCTSKADYQACLRQCESFRAAMNARCTDLILKECLKTTEAVETCRNDCGTQRLRGGC